jgi:heptosyltransferase-3
MAKAQPNKIVISRTDSIGDVVLTLPLAGILKEKFPDTTIVFLGNTYTKPIIACCEHVDEIWEWAVIKTWDYDQQVKWLNEQDVDVFLHIFPRKDIARLAKKANVKIRIGTAHRAFHIMTCNKLVNFTRKRSELHEAQLNTKLLAPLGIKKSFSLEQLTTYLGFNKFPELDSALLEKLKSDKIKVVLHPKSQGSAVEWGVSKFVELATLLDPSKFEIFFTGTEKEASFFRDQLPKADNIYDLSGKMTLEDLISFISNADILVAASTGPLHIAGVCGIKTIGLFADVKPIHPGRWKPLGDQVVIFKSEKKPTSTQPLDIDVRDVVREIEQGS